MLERFILIHAGVDPAPEIVELDSAHLLDGMYQAMQCDSIEIVRVPRSVLLPQGIVLVADENGWYRDTIRYNKFASFWYGDVICGDVLIASEGYRNGEPDLVGLDMLQLHFLRQCFDI